MDLKTKLIMKNIVALFALLLTTAGCAFAQGNSYYGNFNGNAGSTNGGLTNINPAKIASGTAGINITGNAATATLAATATYSTNGSNIFPSSLIGGGFTVTNSTGGFFQVLSVTQPVTNIDDFQATIACTNNTGTTTFRIFTVVYNTPLSVLGIPVFSPATVTAAHPASTASPPCYFYINNITTNGFDFYVQTVASMAAAAQTTNMTFDFHIP